MPARSDFVLTAVLSVFLFTLIKESGQNLSEQAECFHVCGLARQERSKTGVQESRLRSCSQCLKRRKDRHSVTLIRRQQRSSFPFHESNCVGSSKDPSAPARMTPSKVNVTFGQYENTSYWYVNVSWTLMNDSSGYLYATQLRLSVQLNDPNVYCTVLPKNQTFLNINISFYDYTYPKTIWLLVLGLPYRDKSIDFITVRPHIRNPTPATVIKTTASYTDSSSTSTTPSTPFHTRVFPTTNAKSSTTAALTSIIASTKISSIKEGTTAALTRIITSTKISSKEGSNHTIKYVAIASASGIVLGLALVFVFLKCLLWYARRRRTMPVPEGFDYHAFIIYNKEDEKWVKRLVHLLEEKHHLKCCIHYRDFELGSPFYDNMAKSIEKSYKIIAVYSNNFLHSSYCIHELDLAKYRLLNQQDNCLVLIRIDGTDCNKLPEELRERSVIDYHNKLERTLWIGRLLRFLEVPEDCVNQSGITEQDRDNNNSRTIGRRARNSFIRLNSTSSSDTTISHV